MTNVLILSGNCDFARDLNLNLRRHGVNSILLTAQSSGADSAIINIASFRSAQIVKLINHMRSFLYRKVFLKTRGLYVQDISENSTYYDSQRIIGRSRFRPDVVLILFDYRVVTAKTIADLYKKWPKSKIVWMMVDMKPMTGGCAYAGNCIGYSAECRDCPLIGRRIFRNFAQRTLLEKGRLLREVELELIAGSTMQLEQAKNSTLFRDRLVHKIFFPSDEKVFRQGSKSMARQRLGLSNTSKVVMIGAQHFDHPRKGFQFLVSALEIVGRSNQAADMNLLVVGNGQLPTALHRMFGILELGWINLTELAVAYQAADVFVSASIEDSGPLMVNQSIMCVTPVVAFRTGVSVDLVVDGETGYLADVGDSVGLAAGVTRLLSLSPAQRRQIEGSCALTATRLGYNRFVREFCAIIE